MCPTENQLAKFEGGPEAHQNKGAPATLPWETSQRTGSFDHPPCPLSHGFRPRRYSCPQLLLTRKGFCYTLGFEPGLISDASSAKPYAAVPVIHCPPVVILQISEPHAVMQWHSFRSVPRSYWAPPACGFRGLVLAVSVQ